ncbi:hypothetical protein PENSOL_c127G03616 [Penicillium solitum]|uniref:Uncharacterized protein n=1 Tax=Penicillium solitum TaxID=60172 RepID=A0A1V6Q5M4_9EURO|nr:hypothetical protein PENSOL_c127G03616 [Penicillium solitum]
MFGGPPSEV